MIHNYNKYNKRVFSRETIYYDIYYYSRLLSYIQIVKYLLCIIFKITVAS